MKKADGILKNRQLLVIIVAVVLVLAAVAGLTTYTYRSSLKEFAGDGYVLVPSEETVVTNNVNEKYYFAAGTTYRRQLDYAVLFRDTSNHKVSVDTTQFVHYTDGSLAAFSKGVVMELTGLDSEQVTYYGISDKTTLIKDGMLYNMSYLGDSLQLQEFAWKIADDTFMLVAPQITLYLSGDTTASFEDYVQIQYVDGGIVRLINEESTYQTISGEAYLRTDNGAELKLVDKMFYVNGVETVSLADMIIDSSSNLYVDEDEDTVKIPTFNVVNGKDGQSGENGQTAASGESGAEGVNGEDGPDGEMGETGYDGTVGKNGYDGEAGDDGDAAYDGKNGSNGEDAETSVSSDGIASIAQEQIPSVRLATDSYQVTNNSVTMNLSISDPAGLLTGDLTYAIYERASMKKMTSGTISRSYTNAVITYNELLPGTEYLFLVQGEYGANGTTYETDLFTKVFETESVGITLSTVQVTENSITVQTVLDEEVGVSSYAVAIYDEEGNWCNKSAYTKTYTKDETIKFAKETTNLDSGISLKSNSEYTIKIVNITGDNLQLVSSDVSMKVKTLKTTPYYAVEQDDGNGNKTTIKTSINEKKAVVATSSRYHTVTVSLDAGITDPDNGIVRYRYELYNAVSNEQVDSKEIAGLKTVSFDVSNQPTDVQYYGRVVVLFDDNEKLVELASANSEPETMEKMNFPTINIVVKDENVTENAYVGANYDSIAGYVEITDTQNYLLGNISADYPLVLEFQSASGANFTIKEGKDSLVYVAGDTTRAQIAFEQSELLQNTTYTIAVMGPLNTTGTEWGKLSDEQKKFMATTYLGGRTVKTPEATTSNVNYTWTSPTDGNSFAVQFSLSDYEGKSSEYEVGNTETLQFSLWNANTNVKIGDYIWKDTQDEQWHASDLSSCYAGKDGTPSDTILLQDVLFTGMTGDSRVSSGGRFRIVLENGYDYTYQEDLKKKNGYYNEMRYSTLPEGENLPQIGYILNANKTETKASGSVAVEFELSASHTVVSNPNEAVTISYITNENVPEDYQKEGWKDDSNAAVVVTPSYSWGDAISITYYIYRMDKQSEENATLDEKKLVYLNTDKQGDPYELWTTKTITCGTKDAEGKLIGGSVKPWTAYLTDTEKTDDKAGSNLGDDGKTIFERGYQYFIRYEVTCDQTMADKILVYPNDMTVYQKTDDKGQTYQNPPFYRSQVFELKKQAPEVYRYLDSSAQDQAGAPITHKWKYRIVDVDGAIQAMGDGTGTPYAYRLDGTDYATVSGYTADSLTYVPETSSHSEGIVNVANSTNELTQKYFYSNEVGINITDILNATDYADLTTPIAVNSYYRIAIPYLSYKDGLKDNVQFSVSEPVRANPKRDLNNSIVNTGADTTGNYKVTGVMVKKNSQTTVGDTITNNPSGFVDEAGYQIHITLQGDDSLLRVVALRVTFTEVDNETNEVVYDPVSIEVASTMITTADSGQNYYADAYLEYAPIAQKMPEKEVTVTVEAYYATGEEGFGSFSAVKDNLMVSGSNRLTSNDSQIWALKKVDYTEGYKESYVYLNGGSLTESGAISPQKDTKYAVAANSVMVPYIDKEKLLETGFIKGDTVDRFDLYLAYSYGARCLFDSNKPIDTSKIFLCMNETGAKRYNVDSDDSYYVLEKLALKKLQMDVAQTGDHMTYTYKTSCGMPGVSFNTNKSTFGVSSASLRIDTRGQVSNKLKDSKTLDGLYLFLYDADGNPITLKKYQDANGATYYMVTQNADKNDKSDATDKDNDKLVAMASPKSDAAVFSSDFDIVEGKDFNNAAYKSYATAITQNTASTEGNAVFLIRGLEKSTTYKFKLYAKNTAGEFKELYSRDVKVIGNRYQFTTSENINIAASDSAMVYDTYQKRYAAVPFIIDGSEGYNMRIFYKIFDDTGEEVELTDEDISTCGINNYKKNGSQGIGYMIDPLGTSVHYYSGEPGQNNTAKLPLLVNNKGALKRGKTYTVEFYAYTSDNKGNNIEYGKPIGTKKVTVTLPVVFDASNVISLRASVGETSVRASWTINNPQRSIMEDNYTIYIYPSDGSRDKPAVKDETHKATDSVVAGSATYKDLAPNTEYILELYAQMDMNYDGVVDKPLIQSVRFTTSASSSATCYPTFESNKLVINLTDLTNFSEVTTIKYSIYSEDGKVSYKNGEQSVTDADKNSGSIRIPTDFEPQTKNTTYRYQLLYYSTDGTLLGSDDGVARN